MRKLITLCLLLAFTLMLHSQGIDFYEGDYKTAINKAKVEDKLFFVDAFAVWCGPCKRMSKQIFPLEEVGDYFNSKFINMKIDMERGQGLEFRKKYPVSAFPTFFFIDGKGEIVHKFKGGRDAKGLIAEAAKAIAKYDNSEKYAAVYSEGDKSFETVYKYIRALNREGNSSLKVANEYILAHKSLSTEEDLKIVFEALTEVDSKIFDYFIKHKSRILNFTSQEQYDSKILNAARNTFEKSLDFESPSLEKVAFQAVKKNVRNQFNSFTLQCELEKARRTKDSKLYVDNAQKYHKKVIINSESDEVRLVNELLTLFSKDKEALKLGSEIAVNVANNNVNTNNCLLACRTFIKLKDLAKAKKWAEKALEVAGDNTQDKINASQQLKYINSI